MYREYILSIISVDAVKELGYSDFDVEVYVTSRISLGVQGGSFRSECMASAVRSREWGFVKRRIKALSVKEQCRVTIGGNIL